MPNISTRAIAHPSKNLFHQTAKNAGQSGVTVADSYPVKSTSKPSSWGILTITYHEINCTGAYFRNRKAMIIESIMRVVAEARYFVKPELYKPQEKPMMWFLSDIDFGIVIDVMAVTDTDIQNRTVEIIEKLARDCDWFNEITENRIKRIEVLNA